MQLLGTTKTFSRTSRFFFAFYLSIPLILMELSRWLYQTEWSWYQFLVEVGLALSVLFTVRSNFIRITEIGVTSYTVLGKLESSWPNVEGVKAIEIEGQLVRCLVLRTPGSKVGWYLEAEWFVPKEYRGRIMRIPENGPMSYHDCARLLAEVDHHVLAG